jgi:ribokinase
LTPGGEDSAAEVELLLHSLERLRTREGLELVRLQGAGREAARPLTSLPAVLRLVRQYGLDEAHATMHVVTYCIAELLGTTDRVVADVVLAARVMRELYASAGLPPAALAKLYSDNLGTRRAALIQNWRFLHSTIGTEVPPTPADRTLRGQLEPATLRQLARTLWRVAPDRVPTPAEWGEAARAELERFRDQNAVTPAHGSVVVVGGAVMDAMFRVPSLALPEQSSEAYSFDLFPGGKGLTQAVAAARLGCRTELVAAVADDAFGDEIMSLLKSEGVGTTGVRRVQGAHSPVTGVLFEGRQSIAVTWRNEVEIALRPQEVDQSRDLILDADCVLVTFEALVPTVEHLLTKVLPMGKGAPAILTPAPPWRDQALSSHALSGVTYLVAHQWEINQLVTELALPAEHMTMDTVAGRLLQAGIEAVCVLEGTGSKVYRHDAGTIEHPGAPPLVGSAGARDAFAAALALRVLESDGSIGPEDTEWATAAMSAAGGRRVPLSMPHRRLVDDFVHRSPLARQAGGPPSL